MWTVVIFLCASIFFFPRETAFIAYQVVRGTKRTARAIDSFVLKLRVLFNTPFSDTWREFLDLVSPGIDFLTKHYIVPISLWVEPMYLIVLHGAAAKSVLVCRGGYASPYLFFQRPESRWFALRLFDLIVLRWGNAVFLSRPLCNRVLFVCGDFSVGVWRFLLATWAFWVAAVFADLWQFITAPKLVYASTMPVFGSARLWTSCRFIFTELLPYAKALILKREHWFSPTQIQAPDPGTFSAFELVRVFTLPAVLMAGGYPRGGSHVCFMPEFLYLYAVVFFIVLYAFPVRGFFRVGFNRGLWLARWVIAAVVFSRGGFLVGWAMNASPELWGVSMYLTGRSEAALSAFLSALLFCAVGCLEKIFSSTRGERRWLLMSFFFLLSYTATTTFQCYEAASFIWNLELLTAAALGLLCVAPIKLRSDVIFRYVVFNVFGTNATVLGLLHFYATTAFLDFFRIRWLAYTMDGALLTTSPQTWPRVFVTVALLGIFFKVAALPASVGGQSVYLRAGWKFFIFFFVIVKVTYTAAVLRILSLSGAWLPPYTVFAWMFCVAVWCLVVGAFGGVGAKSIGPILAYSSVQHMGYVVAMLAVSYGSVRALAWVMLYLIVYVLTMVLLSAAVARCADRRSGLSKVVVPALAGWVTASVFSLAGCPPFVGFFSKFCAFVVVLSLPAPFLSTCLVFSAIVSIVYYGRIAWNAVLPFWMSFSWTARVMKRAIGANLCTLSYGSRDRAVFAALLLFAAIPTVGFSNLSAYCTTWAIFFIAPYARATPYLQHVVYQGSFASASMSGANAQFMYNWTSSYLSTIIMFHGRWPDYMRTPEMRRLAELELLPTPPSLVYGPAVGPAMLAACFGPSIFTLKGSMSLPIMLTELIVPNAVQLDSEFKYQFDAMDTKRLPSHIFNRQALINRYPALSPYALLRDENVIRRSILPNDDAGI